MHVLRDAETIHAFLASPDLDAELHGLIEARVEELAEYDDMELGELVNFIVMEQTDQIDHVEGQLGFSILSNRFDGQPYGTTDFTPSWDDLADHINWFELVYVISDDGFGLVVFIPKPLDGNASAIDLQLLAMCAEHARSPSEISNL